MAKVKPFAEKLMEDEITRLNCKYDRLKNYFSELLEIAHSMKRELYEHAEHRAYEPLDDFVDKVFTEHGGRHKNEQQ